MICPKCNHVFNRRPKQYRRKAGVSLPPALVDRLDEVAWEQRLTRQAALMHVIIECPKRLPAKPVKRGRPWGERDGPPCINIPVMFTDAETYSAFAAKAKAAGCTFSSYLRAAIEHYVVRHR